MLRFRLSSCKVKHHYSELCPPLYEVQISSMWGSDLLHMGFKVSQEVQTCSICGSDSIHLRIRLMFCMRFRPPCFGFWLLPCEFQTSSMHLPIMRGSAFLQVRFSLHPCEIRTPFIWGLDFLQVKFCFILIVQWHSPNEKRCLIKFKDIYVPNVDLESVAWSEKKCDKWLVVSPQGQDIFHICTNIVTKLHKN